LDEARRVAGQIAALVPGESLTPAHYPHSQIVALAKLVVALDERLAKLESEKPRRGRPPRHGDVTAEAVGAELAVA
jgi:hypothetical protein